jgi:hypothetical protein
LRSSSLKSKKGPGTLGPFEKLTYKAVRFYLLAHLAKYSAVEPYMRTEGKIGANRSWGVASPRSS